MSGYKPCKLAGGVRRVAMLAFTGKLGAIAWGGNAGHRSRLVTKHRVRGAGRGWGGWGVLGGHGFNS